MTSMLNKLVFSQHKLQEELKDLGKKRNKRWPFILHEHHCRVLGFLLLLSNI